MPVYDDGFRKTTVMSFQHVPAQFVGQLFQWSQAASLFHLSASDRSWTSQYEWACSEHSINDT